MGNSAIVILDKGGELSLEYKCKLGGHPSSILDTIEDNIIEAQNNRVGYGLYTGLRQVFDSDGSWKKVDSGEADWYYLIRRDGEVFMSQDRKNWSPKNVVQKSTEDILTEVTKHDKERFKRRVRYKKD